MTHVGALGGVDPSGGAGLDADRAAARELGVELTAIVTAWTDQDASGVRSVEPRAVDEWLAEARGVRASVWKTGLLPTAAAVRAVAELASDSGPLVVDPVLAPTRGVAFLDEAGVAALRDVLLPAGPILTPNLDEAAVLAGLPRAELEQAEGRRAAARALLDLGAAAVLLKAGHGSEDPARDLVLEHGAEPLWIERPRLPGGIRGSGCRYATAVACELARGAALGDAARRAGELVAAAIARRLRDDSAERP